MYRGDNRRLLAEYPDGYFDLVLDDPPYGIGEGAASRKNHNRPVKQKNGKVVCLKGAEWKAKDWDRQRPDRAYFAELRRVSKAQVIWGGNYFADLLPPSPGWVVWDKINGSNDFSDFEMAYTSIPGGARLFRYMWNGMMQGKSLAEPHIPRGNKKTNEQRIHPTQKPELLYLWLLDRFAKPGMRILDPHMGSGSSAVAVLSAGMNLEYVGIEKDAEYYSLATARVGVAYCDKLISMRQYSLPFADE